MAKSMMERVKLTDKSVDGLKPRAEKYRVYDSAVPTLFVRVMPSGIKSWYVAWARNRETVLGKYPGVTVTAAREQARQAMIEANSGTPEAARRRVKAATLRGFLDPEDEHSYGAWVLANRKSGKKTLQRINSVFSDFLDKPLTSINAWVIEKWRTKRIKLGNKPASANRDLIALRGALTKAVEWKVLEAHPLAGVKKAKEDDDPRVRFLSDEEEIRLRASLAARDAAAIEARSRANHWRQEREYELLPEIPTDGFADHLTPFVLVSLNCGTRRGELTGLTWENVDLARRVMAVKASTSKSAKTRRVPLNDEAANVLERWRRQCSGERIFDFYSIKTAWASLMKAAKIADFRPHDMRHHFASKLVQADVSLYHVQKLLGHGSSKMTERYSHLQDSDLATAVSRLKTA